MLGNAHNVGNIQRVSKTHREIPPEYDLHLGEYFSKVSSDLFVGCMMMKNMGEKMNVNREQGKL
jgi:hypothetical protein